MIVISDVHGCYKTLLALIAQLPTDEELCFVGDLIDRGPQSKDVIEFVKSNNHKCVLGNHEDMMDSAYRSGHPYMDSGWAQNGGQQTMESYTSPADDDMLLEHLDWIRNLPTYIEFPELTCNTDKERYLVVSHSSVARYWKWHETQDITLNVIWNRDISHGTLPSSNNIFNIFGHTVHKEPKLTKFFACIDTGACYKGHKGYEKLTAIQFPSMKLYTQENIEG